jgi:hypothetical protein
MSGRFARHRCPECCPHCCPAGRRHRCRCSRRRGGRPGARSAGGMPASRALMTSAALRTSFARRLAGAHDVSRTLRAIEAANAHTLKRRIIDSHSKPHTARAHLATSLTAKTEGCLQPARPCDARRAPVIHRLTSDRCEVKRRRPCCGHGIYRARPRHRTPRRADWHQRPPPGPRRLGGARRSPHQPRRSWASPDTEFGLGRPQLS